jgi:chemotaxis protein methyltransferase CheR
MPDPRGKVTEELFDAAAELVRVRTGLVFGDASRDRLVTALAQELQGGTDARALIGELRRTPAQVDALAAATTIAESYFLREPEQFEWLRRVAIPQLRARGPAVPLTIWCAGCSRGEEPYSLAILLREMGDAGPIRIVGSDLSPRSIVRARAAKYTPWSLRAATPAFVERWFRKSAGEFVLDQGIRDRVEFVVHNLAADPCPPPASGIVLADIIVCRNVLIYFDPPSVTRVASRLLDALTPEGWLLLGVSDPPIGDPADWETVPTGSGLAYRRRRPEIASVIPPRVQMPPDPPASPDPPALSPSSIEEDASPPETVALAAYAARDYARASAAAEQLVLQTPDAVAGWTMLMRSQANLGRIEAAQQTALAALDRLPLSAEVACVAALLFSATGRDGDAERTARRAIYLDHTMAAAHGILGGALARLVRRDAASCEEALRAFDNAERLLGAMAPVAPVPEGDGELAGMMLARIRAQRALLLEVRRDR